MNAMDTKLAKDAILLALVRHQFKVARIVFEVAEKLEIDPEDVAWTIQELVDENILEPFGNLNKWRHSEIRMRVGL